MQAWEVKVNWLGEYAETELIVDHFWVGVDDFEYSEHAESDYSSVSYCWVVMNWVKVGWSWKTFDG